MMPSMRSEFYGILVPDFNDKMSRLSIFKGELTFLEERVELLKEKIEAGKKARIIFQEVAQETQQNLENHISNLVSLALKAVSPEFPNFIAEMKIRRNQLECDFWFEKDGYRVPPKNSVGGGPKNVASFALVVSYWAMDKNRATLILDEPFRDVSPDLQPNIGDMLRMISDKLNLQLIIVSHADMVNESADKVFEVDLVGEESKLL